MSNGKVCNLRVKSRYANVPSSTSEDELSEDEMALYSTRPEGKVHRSWCTIIFCYHPQRFLNWYVLITLGSGGVFIFLWVWAWLSGLAPGLLTVAMRAFD
jgi:hypothetical protein